VPRQTGTWTTQSWPGCKATVEFISDMHQLLSQQSQHSVYAIIPLVLLTLDALFCLVPGFCRQVMSMRYGRYVKKSTHIPYDRYIFPTAGLPTDELFLCFT
jgi:hypothetical protein